MNGGFERAVREAVQDLASEARAVNLSDVAIRQGRRIIVRRRILSAAAAAAVAAALAVPFVLANDRSAPIQPGAAPADAAPPSAAAPTPPAVTANTPIPNRVPVPIGKGLVKVGSGWILLAAPSTRGTWVYDRSRLQYSVIPYSHAYPAPSGELVMVSEPGRVGLYNLRSNTTRWVTGPANVVGGFDWSEDGTRVLYPVAGTTTSTLRLGVLDVSSLRLKVFGTDIECYENCSPAWVPGGKEIALAPDAAANGVQTYSSYDGTPVRTLKLPGAIPALHSWSPDGTLVATRAGAQTVIADERTGAQLLSLNERTDGVYWLTNSSLLVVRSDGFATYGLDGTIKDFYPAPTGVAADELSATILSRS